MRKFTIKLTDGKEITEWARDQREAIEKACEDYPSAMIVSVNDNSPINPVIED